jgi:HSP20 family protein
MARDKDIARLQEEVAELFADLWQVPGFAKGMRHGFRPAADCFRTDDPAELTVVVDVAGADAASLQIVASGRTLVVAGKRPRPRGTAQVYYRSEIEYGPFQREIQLAEDVDPQDARATYDGGLLRVVLPIARRPRGERVPIEVRAAR